jgi:hypothetical protein
MRRLLTMRYHASGSGVPIRQDLAAWQATGAKAGGPALCMLPADAHGKVEQPEERLTTLAEKLEAGHT